MFISKIIFLILVFHVKKIFSLNSSEICFKNTLYNEECARLWSFDCGKNYCTHNEKVCDNFNEIEKFVKVNKM